jgi:hypothetical protein
MVIEQIKEYNHTDKEKDFPYLVKRLNTREGLIALCNAIISKQNRTSSSEEKNQVVDDVKCFIKKTFLIKNYPEQLAEEYSSIIHAAVKKELVLQRAFLALEG